MGGSDTPLDDDLEVEDSLPEAGAPVGRSLNTLVVPQRSDRFALIQRVTLQVVSGPDAGATLASKGDKLVVGKHRSADLVLSDPAVSRFHCEIAVGEGRVVIRDLGSRNGTFVNGVSVLGAYLRSGSVVSVGRTQFRLEVGADSVSLPLSREERFGSLVGASMPMRRAFALLERAAASDATVLIEGETGTGKEAAAEAIHRAGVRSPGPFIVVDCGAIPSELLESELFGHERGAFTGAVTAREGAFDAAQGGTIFLDEIGELGTDLQPKLLRALERREVKRVGASRYHAIDVRVVAATNRNLKAEVNARRFRSDLYYRLAVFELRLPPLRDRVEDLPLLVGHLLDALGADRTVSEPLRTVQFLADLARHNWPGNVRELRNYLERCLAMQEQPPLGEPGDDDAPVMAAGAPVVDPRQPLKEAREKWVRSFERPYLEQIMKLNDGNVSAAARAAGVDRIYFYRLLWRHGLK